MKLNLLFCLALAAMCYAQAQPINFLSGKVEAHDSHAPIPYATLSIPGTAYQSTADAYGYFRISIPEQPHFQLKVSSIGFESKIFQVHTKNRESITITLKENPYLLETQEIVAPMDVLRKAFSSNDYLYQGGFAITRFFTCDQLSERVEGIGKFYYVEGFWQSGLIALTQKRNITSEKARAKVDPYWVDYALTFWDRVTPPCPLEDNKCWSQKIQTEYLGTTYYDNRKVYKVSLRIGKPKLDMVDGPPFSKFDRYEAEYLIDAETFAFLQRKSVLYAATRKEGEPKQLINAKAGKFKPISMTLIRNYRPYKGKYFPSFFRMEHELLLEADSQGLATSNAHVEMELTTLEIQTETGQKFTYPPLPKGQYHTWEINNVPYNKEFWEAFDNNMNH